MELRGLQQEEVFGRNDIQEPSSAHDYGRFAEFKKEILRKLSDLEQNFKHDHKLEVRSE